MGGMVVSLSGKHITQFNRKNLIKTLIFATPSRNGWNKSAIMNSTKDSKWIEGVEKKYQ